MENLKYNVVKLFKNHIKTNTIGFQKELKNLQISGIEKDEILEYILRTKHTYENGDIEFQIRDTYYSIEINKDLYMVYFHLFKFNDSTSKQRSRLLSDFKFGEIKHFQKFMWMLKDKKFEEFDIDERNIILIFLTKWIELYGTSNPLN